MKTFGQIMLSLLGSALVFLATPAFAEASRPSNPSNNTGKSSQLSAPHAVIDVGDLEVKGEIRKPMVQYIDSDQVARSVVPRVATEELLQYEATLTAPSAPEAPPHGQN